MGGFIANVGKNGDGLEQSVGKYVPKPNLWKTGRIVNLVSGLMTIETLLPQKQGQGNLNGSQKLLHWRSKLKLCEGKASGLSRSHQKHGRHPSTPLDIIQKTPITSWTFYLPLYLAGLLC
ncbi:hypothetical protein Y1Q_0001652 [Alligator mississippiensis]|uniref:Uncharacterized protein n=1 Tax=Alligator mississippiensis TaxID=8496 RepID=A0A151MA95_ALLMI|nr:hypothetical protein Y1Q_0001652 [Alligator mississippiensis]